MRVWLPVAALSVAILYPTGTGAQSEPPITRVGEYWEQTVTGTIPVNPGIRVRFLTEGSIVVQGRPGGGPIQYTLKKRVRADSLEAAKRDFAAFQVRTRGGPGSVIVNLTLPKGHLTSAELTASLPRSLQQYVLETVGGNVAASDLQGDLQVDTAGGRIDLDRLGGDAAVKTGGGEIHVGRINGGLRCLSGGGNIQVANLGREGWLETAGGDISVSESGAALHASTSGGNIRVGRCAGEVQAWTGGGVIDVQRAAGLVRANTNGGAIQINAANGVRCESSAGAIRIRNLAGGTMQATTAIGSILAEILSGTRIEDSLLSTHAGDITVLISSKVPVTVQARNESSGGPRRIVSDFPEIRIVSRSTEPVLAEGALNGGGPLLRIVASGGTIYLRRYRE